MASTLNMRNGLSKFCGASRSRPQGDLEEPAWTMETQIYPRNFNPSDEALVKSLYRLLLDRNWQLPNVPHGLNKEEYILPPSLTGNNLWIQRKEAFLRENPVIKDNKIYLAKRETFMAWIEARFNARTVGQYGPTQDRCFKIARYVLWVDRQDIGPHPPIDLPVGSNSASESRYWSYDTPAGPSQASHASGSSPRRRRSRQTSSSSSSNLPERISQWRMGVTKEQNKRHS
ncbi:hypothetical protein F4861DRAFT_547283 [Xylaria intraflava]|nr:hypothetical protein F4861DRAFT_547283 [Xylaria intraflava]